MYFADDFFTARESGPGQLSVVSDGGVICLDIGLALGSLVSFDYYDKVPFRFNGTIESVHVRYTM